MDKDLKNIDEIRGLVEERRRVVEDGGAQQAGDPEPEPSITSELITECLYANALGDGILFAELHKGKFMYHNLAEQWLSWSGHHWLWDHNKLALKSVEKVAQVYLEESRRLVDKIDWAIKKNDKDRAQALQDKQSDIYKRVARLRGPTGRENCLLFARSNSVSSLDTKGDDFDADPWLFACANGVIDLKTGELLQGRPDHKITRASGVEWQGIDIPAPNWEKFLVEIFQGDQELIDYVQRVLGYGMSGLTVEHVVPVLWGPHGRNGKGVLVGSILRILGDYAGPIEAEMLLDSGRGRSSAGPSPDIMNLQGLRIAFASETEQNRRFSTAKLKWLSGSDKLIGRWPHEKRPVSFDPSHLLVMLTNNRPHAPADDSAFWERIALVPFEISFIRHRECQGDCERPANIHLQEKLLQESSGILSWIVRGCLAWQQRGLDPPDLVRAATQAYRRDEDILADFIDSECALSRHAESTAKELYERFEQWWESEISSKKIPSKKRFGQWMKRKFESVRRSDGYYYLGLELKNA